MGCRPSRRRLKSRAVSGGGLSDMLAGPGPPAEPTRAAAPTWPFVTSSQRPQKIRFISQPSLRPGAAEIQAGGEGLGADSHVHTSCLPSRPGCGDAEPLCPLLTREGQRPRATSCLSFAFFPSNLPSSLPFLQLSPPSPSSSSLCDSVRNKRL